MINSFLVTLVNSGTPVVNGSASCGNVLWPSAYRVKTYTPELAVLRQGIYGPALGTPLHTLLQSVCLLKNLRASPFVRAEKADDPRVTYTDAQLHGLFVGAAFPTNTVGAALAFLKVSAPVVARVAESSDVVREAVTSLTPLDVLAAITVELGKR